MRERGMIFNAQMVRAILDGRKTQTRRIVAVQPESNQFGMLRITDSTKRSDIGKCHWAESNATGTHTRSKLFSCPFGQPGDRLWVRETHRVHSRATDVATLVYKASERQSWTQQTHRVPISECNKPVSAEKWTPSIHMPRWASRITLEITGIRVERLNSISETDALAEGVKVVKVREGGDRYCDYASPEINHYRRPSDSFISLWESIYGDESWQHSPWVWVVEFKRVEDNDHG